VDRVEGGNAGCRDRLAQGVEFGGGLTVSGTRASASSRRLLAATSAERQKLAPPIGHHRGSWSSVADRSTLNSRGLLMSTRNTLA
jgi:hypothetical protein